MSLFNYVRTSKAARRRVRLAPFVDIAFDGVPVPRGLAVALADARAHGWSGHVNSADRRKGVAEKFHKKSQWYLYMAYWVWRLPGYLPANRPGISTHEWRSDGRVYRGPVGRKLKWWGCGIDASEAEELVAVLNHLGYRAHRPYHTASEAHHLNFKKDPLPNLKRRRLA